MNAELWYFLVRNTMLPLWLYASVNLFLSSATITKYGKVFGMSIINEKKAVLQSTIYTEQYFISKNEPHQLYTNKQALIVLKLGIQMVYKM